MLSFCKKFVWYIEYVVLNEYKWWTVNTYQSYVTDKHFKHSVEIMDSQDQEVHDERKEPQEEDIPNNTKKGKNDFLKSLKRVDPHWNLELQDTKEEVEDGADEDHKVDWSTIKVFVKSRPKTLDADAKLSEDDIFLIILEHTGEDRARILANMAITVR